MNMSNYNPAPPAKPSYFSRHNAGFSLIEVLVTIVILLVGLLGLAGLQGRALTAQMEAYQRSQALILLKDMADRISANRTNAAAYITGTSTPLGTDSDPCTATGAGSAADRCEWSNALKGAAETKDGNQVGAMIGARGCITQIAAPGTGVPSEYVVTVAWQGFNSTAAPASLCGKDLYGDDALRRVVSLPISLANLTSP